MHYPGDVDPICKFLYIDPLKQGLKLRQDNR